MKTKTQSKTFSRKRSLTTQFWLPTIAALFDVIAVTFAAMLAFYLRFFSPLHELYAPNWQPKTINYFFFGLLLGLVYITIAWSYKGYSGKLRAPLEEEVGVILRGSLLAMGVVMAIIFFYREFTYSRLVFLGTYFLMMPALIISHSLFHRLRTRLFKKGVGMQRVVLWGSGEIAEKLAKEFPNNHSKGFELIGSIGSTITGVSSLGEIHMLKHLVFEHELDLIVMAPPSGSEEQMNEIMKAAEGLPVELLYVPAAVNFAPSRVRVTEVGGRPLLRLKTLPMTGWGYVAKRMMDFTLSGIFLLILSPLYLLLTLAVLLDSGKPIFYRQKRVGMDGREFDIIKFRTMRTDAETQTGPVWAVKGDNRTTRIGKFLRRWSLDELPQIWTVFIGYMSLVGPRPERPHFVEQFSQHIPQYLDRHRVKSGLTGWAQVSGFRGSDTTIEERTEYDLYYIENWSIWFDLRILLKTVGAVIGGKGAM